MPSNFSYFVILASMRTGSNFLQESLNQLKKLQCHGELFNPAFAGSVGKTEFLGRSLADIARDPAETIRVMQGEADTLPGFRLFADHSPAALEHVLNDPDCAKIILSRNPVDSFVSLKIVQKTDQWRLADGKNVKRAPVVFDMAEFQEYFDRQQGFYNSVRHTLKATGQAPFEVHYSELDDLDVLNGLARFLGLSERLSSVSKRTRKQNPEPISQKVSNFPEMVAGLGTLDPLGLYDEPNFEPARKPGIPNFVATNSAPLLFAPVNGGPNEGVTAWLAGIDDVATDKLLTGFSQKTLRSWKRANKGHVSFTVLRHPVKRAFSAYLKHFVSEGPERFSRIRDIVISHYGGRIPSGDPATISETALAEGFLDFLKFVRSSLAGQAAARVDGAWASQEAILAAIGRFGPLDHLFREADIVRDLNELAGQMGLNAQPVAPDLALEHQLDRIYSDSVEAAVKAVYQRDYMLFGFGSWGLIKR